MSNLVYCAIKLVANTFVKWRITAVLLFFSFNIHEFSANGTQIRKDNVGDVPASQTPRWLLVHYHKVANRYSFMSALAF